MLRSLSHNTKQCDTYVYTSFLQPDQAKAVRELTQHVRETNSKVSEQDVGETIRRRNERKPFERGLHMDLRPGSTKTDSWENLIRTPWTPRITWECTLFPFDSLYVIK